MDAFTAIEVQASQNSADDAAAYLSLVTTIAADGNIDPQAALDDAQGFGRTIDDLKRDVADVKHLAKLRETIAGRDALSAELKEIGPKIADARVELKNTTKALEEKLRRLIARRSTLHEWIGKSNQAEKQLARSTEDLHRRIGLPVAPASVWPE